jgi:hypothetical protein
MAQEADRDEQRILERYGNLLNEKEKALLQVSSEAPARTSNNFSIKKQYYTRRKILPSSYLSSQKFDLLFGVLVFVIYHRLFLVENSLPPFSAAENSAAYGILGVACIVLFLRIKFYYEKEKSVFYTKILILVSALWLFFNLNMYFGHIVGLFLFALLIVPWACLYFSRKTDFALLYLTSVSLFCLFSIIGKIWITVILGGFLGIIRKIIRNFDPLQCRATDINGYFLFSYLKGFGVIQGVGGACFLGVHIYASEWLESPRV